MNTLLARQLGELVAGAGARCDALYEAPLRVAVGTLLRAATDEVSATTVVGIVGADDVPAFQALVDRIAEEYGVEAQIRLRADAFSVRFSRPAITRPIFTPTVAPRRLGFTSRVRTFLRG